MVRHAYRLIDSAMVIENVSHGTQAPESERVVRPLTKLEPGDKRNAILIALHEFPEKSQQEIAEQVGCSQQYVAKVKDNTTGCNIPENESGHTRTWTGTIECNGGRMVSPFEGTGKGVLEYLAEKRVSRNRASPHAYKMFCV